MMQDLTFDEMALISSIVDVGVVEILTADWGRLSPHRDRLNDAQDALERWFAEPRGGYCESCNYHDDACVGWFDDSRGMVQICPECLPRLTGQAFIGESGI